jgi:hypothetical protein
MGFDSINFTTDSAENAIIDMAADNSNDVTVFVLQDVETGVSFARDKTVALQTCIEMFVEMMWAVFQTVNWFSQTQSVTFGQSRTRRGSHINHFVLRKVSLTEIALEMSHISSLRLCSKAYSINSRREIDTTTGAKVSK